MVRVNVKRRSSGEAHRHDLESFEKFTELRRTLDGKDLVSFGDAEPKTQLRKIRDDEARRQFEPNPPPVIGGIAIGAEPRPAAPAPTSAKALGIDDELATLRAALANVRRLEPSLEKLQDELQLLREHGSLESERQSKLETDLVDVRQQLEQAAVEVRRQLSDDNLRRVIAQATSALDQTVLTKLDQFVDHASAELKETCSASVAMLRHDLQTAVDGAREVLDRIGDESELVRLRADERREFIQKYRPGTIEQLRQQIEQQQERIGSLERERAELVAARRDNELRIKALSTKSGELSRDDLNRRLDELATREAAVRGAEAVKVERDGLRERVDELERLRHVYESAQAVQRSDDSLRARSQQLQDDLARISDERDDAKAKASRLETAIDDRDAKLRALADRLDAETGRCEMLQTQIDELRESQKSVDQERQKWAERREQLEAHHQQLVAREATLQQREHDELVRLRKLQQMSEEPLALRARQLDERERDLEATVTNRIRREHEAKTVQLERAAKDVPRLEAEIRELEARLETAQRERVEHLAAVAQREQEIAAQERKLQQLTRSVEELETRRRTLVEELGELREEQERAKAELAALDVARRETRDLHEQLRAAEKAELDRLVNRRQTLEDRTTSREARLEPIVRAWDDSIRAPRADSGERAWLADIERRIGEAGFRFPRRLLEAFHTSLKTAAWAPITALAGVSGTGKSELPRLYAEFGGLCFLSVPIQPNWDSPQDLFGFFNYMDGRFRATELVRALHQAARPASEGGLDETLLLVLLDEMNRARFELYFSELLSRLESRRGATSIAESSIEVDLGAGIDRPERIRLGDNLLFVGTMNEDETTHSLSDMVLDRGNVISFPRPRRLQRRDHITKLERVEGQLELKTWRGWLRDPSSLPQGTRDKLGSVLSQVNEALARVNRAIGHRVLQAVEAYVANHPAVCADEASETSYVRPLEDQLAQKVMPKLRGIETESRAGRECLDAIGRLIDEDAAGLAADFRRSRESSEGAFVWTAGSYLDDVGEA